MKKLLLLPLAFAFASNAAMAANSVDLRVTGTITPAACDITLVGGDVDFGSISGNDLKSTEHTDIAPISRSLNVLCSGATLVGIKAVDNRTGTASQTSSAKFGIGSDTQGNKIGHYLIDFKNTTVDGQAGGLTQSSDTGATWTSIGTGFLTSDPAAIFSWTTPGVDDPVAVTSITQSFEIDLKIAPTQTLDTSTDIAIDGSATIELVYL